MTKPLTWKPFTRYHDLVLDFDQTRAFLEYLAPQAVEKRTKFVFAHMVSVLNEKEQLVARNVQNHWTFDEYVKNAKKIQDHGWNFFVCVNETAGARRRAQDISKVRAHFLDFDEEPLELPTLCTPDLIVRSKRGQHWYWHTGPMDKPSTWRAVQRGLIKRFGGDIAVCDLPRVMRLPGAFHLKDLKNPYLVNIEYSEPTPRKYTYTSAHLATTYNLDTTPDPKDAAQRTAVDPSDLTQLPFHLVELFRLFELRGERPLRTKDGWLFCCPHHGDRNPSLLVRLMGDGQISLHCRSRRCESDDILHALNVGWGMRYPLGYRPNKEAHDSVVNE